MIKLRIGHKLLFFTVLTAIVMLTVIAVQSRRFFLKNFNTQINNQVELKIEHFNSVYENLQNDALYISTLCAEMNFVRDAYQHYETTNDVEATAAMLDSALYYFIHRLEQETGQFPQIHFHTKDGISLYRSWSNQRGDDLSDFRHSLTLIGRTHKPVAGMEIGSAGFVVRGISPVFSHSSRFIGTVEVLFPFDRLLNESLSDSLNQSALFVHNSKVSIADNISLMAVRNNQNVANYSLINMSSQNFRISAIDEQLIEEALVNGRSIHTAGRLVFGAYPLTDFSETVIAVVVFQIDGTRIFHNLNTVNRRLIIYSLLSILLGGIIFYLIIKLMVSKPLEEIRDRIAKMSTGVYTKPLSLQRQDEIGDIANSLDCLNNARKRTADFASEIGRGNFKAEYKTLGSSDIIGNALLEMRDSFEKAKETEAQRKKEDDKQNWITRGMARFGDILRQHNEDINTLADYILRELVSYMNATQGGLFLFNNAESEEEAHLELLTSYAYNRKKLLTKKVSVKESLIGVCALEKQTLNISNLPQDYVKVTSGLGEANPDKLLIVPLKLEEEVLGVVELSSFKAFEQHEIEFVEKVGENIASTLSISKINAQTARLLEQSQQQAKELLAKEEQMRQNMEELRLTQDEAARKEALATGFVDAVNHSIIRADYDVEGHLLYANSKFLEKTGYSTKEVDGMPVFMLIDQREERQKFRQIWLNLINGGKHFEGEVKYKTQKGYVWLLATYTAVRDRQGTILKILHLSIDISKQKQESEQFKEELLKREEEATGFVNSVNHSNLRVDFELDGTLQYANSKFLDITGYTSREIDDKSISFFIRDEDRNTFLQEWDRLGAGGKHLEKEMMLRTKDNSMVWIFGTFTIVRNRRGEPVKILLLGFDITQRKQEIQQLHNEIDRLTDE